MKPEHSASVQQPHSQVLRHAMHMHILEVHAMCYTSKQVLLRSVDM
jgi:hypothetical protein